SQPSSISPRRSCSLWRSLRVPPSSSSRGTLFRTTSSIESPGRIRSFFTTSAGMTRPIELPHFFAFVSTSQVIPKVIHRSIGVVRESRPWLRGRTRQDVLQHRLQVQDRRYGGGGSLGGSALLAAKEDRSRHDQGNPAGPGNRRDVGEGDRMRRRIPESARRLTEEELPHVRGVSVVRGEGGQVPIRLNRRQDGGVRVSVRRCIVRLEEWTDPDGIRREPIAATGEQDTA